MQRKVNRNIFLKYLVKNDIFLALKSAISFFRIVIILNIILEKSYQDSAL